MNTKKRSSGSGLGMIFMFLIILTVFYLISFEMPETEEDYEYSDFLVQVETDSSEIKELVIHQNQEIPTGEIVVTMQDGTRKKAYVSDVNEVEDIAQQYGIRYQLEDVSRLNIWANIILPICIMVFMFVILFLMIRRQGANSGANAQMMNFGKSRAQKVESSKNPVTFNDVAGLKEEKEDLSEIVDFLREPARYTKLGARIPKGVILTGPPGTGKTLLAKAVAGEAGVPFYSISGSDFVEMFVGVGASRVRDMFEEAKKNAPCIVFIDEIDAVARRRGAGLGGGHDEREQTLNQLLVEMDGFSPNAGIIVMAATNRIDILDPAIMRPGRFDRKVVVGLPDVDERLAILKVHARKKPMGDDVDLEALARTTAGFAGADLENILNEAAIRAARERREYINNEDIQASFVKEGIGTEKKSRIISDKEKRITAYHESGHAILFHCLPEVGPVHMISIIPTGLGAAGYTMPLPSRDEMFNTRGKMLQQIIVDFGGRVAESLVFDDITTGASQDIRQATKTARDMVMKYGFSDKLGPIDYSFGDSDEVFIGRDIGHARPYGEDVTAMIDAEVKRIVDYCYGEAKRLIEENRSVLDASANLLLKKEKVTGEEFDALFTAPAPQAD
ncbi:MAG: ATP-dependent zinc metalloprotease FtsH [Lachnospiraceae bacterium]|jgi:cell division protease FtsH